MENNLNQFIKICISLEIYTRMHHWNTTNYALHKATDQFIDSLLDIMDKFVEVYIGLYNVRPSFNQVRVDNCCLTDIDNKKYVDILSSYTELVRGLNLDNTKTELLNIRDELLAEMNKTKYLLSLS